MRRSLSYWPERRLVVLKPNKKRTQTLEEVVSSCLPSFKRNGVLILVRKGVDISGLHDTLSLRSPDWTNETVLSARLKLLIIEWNHSIDCDVYARGVYRVNTRSVCTMDVGLSYTRVAHLDVSEYMRSKAYILLGCLIRHV